MKRGTLSYDVFTGIGYGMSMFGAGFCCGTIRVLFLVPSIGGDEVLAVLVELPFMLVICWLLMSKYFLQRLSTKISAAILVGVVAFAALVLLEVALSLLVIDKTMEETLEDFASTKGMIGLAALALSSFFPAIQLMVKPKQGKEQ